jgi:hypothetical protein
MAEENRSIPESSAAAHVAFDLMKFISTGETRSHPQKDRTYWLTLYRQCYKAAFGRSLKQILEDEPQK